MTRFILLLLVIFAFASAPSAMAKGAPVMPQTAAAAADGGHCSGAGSHEDAPDGAGGQLDCSAACSVAPALLAALLIRIKVAPAPLALAAHNDLVGIHPEGEKPPPRIPPEI